MTTRRNFLTGAAGLVALAVSGPTLAVLTQNDRDRLLAQIAAGRVENQLFLLPDPGPIVVSTDGPSCYIHNCAFVWQVPSERACVEFVGDSPAKGWTISHCLFVGGHQGPVDKATWEQFVADWMDTRPETPEREALIQRIDRWATPNTCDGPYSGWDLADIDDYSAHTQVMSADAFWKPNPLNALPDYSDLLTPKGTP